MIFTNIIKTHASIHDINPNPAAVPTKGIYCSAKDTTTAVNIMTPR